MPHFFYAENVERGAPPKVPYEKWNACKHWASHTYNLIVLHTIASSTPDMREKMQAENEILICERKRTFWTRHPNFEPQAARRLLKQNYGIAELPGNIH